MRITIEVDAALLHEATARATASGSTRDAVIEDALREAFARDDSVPSERLPLPVNEGSQLRAGVDLDDSAALLELMDQSDARR